MKIRNGFVSNSSSSSFVCDVCGTAESGMDASAHDFDMETCCNGHTFCNSHAESLPETTLADLRENIKAQIASNTWWKVENKKARLQELEDTSDDELEDYYNENYSDDGVTESKCPVCSMIVLRDVDGFAYLKKKLGVTDDNILNEIKADFKTYTDFTKHIHPGK